MQFLQKVFQRTRSQLFKQKIIHASLLQIQMYQLKKHLFMRTKTATIRKTIINESINAVM